MVCDFQAIYRLRIDPDVGDVAGLSGPQFVRLASRLPGYPGSIMRIRAENADPPPQQQPQAAVQQLEATPLMLTTQPLMASLFEYSTAPPAEEPPAV